MSQQFLGNNKDQLKSAAESSSRKRSSQTITKPGIRVRRHLKHGSIQERVDFAAGGKEGILPDKHISVS